MAHTPLQQKTVCLLTLSASISLWNSPSQNFGSVENMELSVTWLPNFVSNQSDSKSLASSNNIYKTIILSAPDQDLPCLNSAQRSYSEQRGLLKEKDIWLRIQRNPCFYQIFIILPFVNTDETNRERKINW